MFEWFLKTFGGTIIEAAIKAIGDAFRVRRLDKERLDDIVGRRDAEHRAADAEAKVVIQKEMANAQTNAPDSRAALIERLRKEAAESAGLASGTG